MILSKKYMIFYSAQIIGHPTPPPRNFPLQEPAVQKEFCEQCTTRSFYTNMAELATAQYSQCYTFTVLPGKGLYVRLITIPEESY
jgi:hypothetical protein